MRRYIPLARHGSVLVRLALGASLAAGLAFTTIQAQIPGRNVNMVSGTKWPDGDPFLQRQNEPSVAASTRNPLHLLGGSNDYRTVDVPGMPDGVETGDAWLGLFKSTDGGQRWTSTLLPGYPQDQSPAGLASPLKSYQAGADAVVRAGTNGLLYYSGLVFDRAEDGKSGIFLARFIDNNNQEAGDPIAYLGTKLVASSDGAKFLDKPWMAVDIPRGNAAMCTITSDSILATAQDGRRRRHDDRHEKAKQGKGKSKGKGKGNGNGGGSAPGTQRIPAGAVYVAYSSITGDAATLRSEILLTRSLDCGNTWSAPIKVSRPEDAVNQGSSLTIDPRNGTVYVGWRRFDPDLTDNNDLDAVMVARLPFGASKFDAPARAHKFQKPERKVGRKLHRLFEHRANRFKDVSANEALENLDQFDLGTTGFNFRTNAYPTMATDGTGRVYIAWTQRGFTADPSTPDPNGVGGARIVIATTRDGRTFSAPQPVDDHSTPGRGHQLMPSMAFAGGKLMLVFYDLRDSKAATHNRISSDFNTNTGLRQTIDIRSAMASPGDTPNFAPSVKVSDYLMGFNPESGQVEELQVNPPNLPMFKLGTVPFMGDYIDVAAAPAFVPIGNGKWAYNTADTGALPTFHAVWTDNRDVRPPRNGEWWNYTPARMSSEQLAGASIFDPTQTVPLCTDNGTGNPGSRNQNVYSARITGGLLAGSPGNAKPLSPELQRGFVVFAQNTSRDTKSFRMTILNQPPGGRASFDQFPAPPYVGAVPPPETAVEMIVPPLSTASRTVYVTSSDPKAQLNVDVTELVDLRTLASPTLYPTAPEKTDGLEARVILNPDIENPDIENPDIENPDIENPDIENAEVYNPDIENPDIENPDIENPDIENPDIENPDIENPDIENPDIENVRVANPDIENPDIENPDIENPDIENPDIENPDIENPDIENGAIADITWKVTNDGNTTASFNVNLFLSQQTLPAGVKTQLILLKTYRTPVTVPNGCQLGFQTRNILLANIRNPILVPPGGGTANANDPAETNATLWLAPGEEGRIVLRVIDEDTSNNVPVTKPNGDVEYVDPSMLPTEDVSPVVQQQAVNTEDVDEGPAPPPVVTPPPPPATDDTVWTSPNTPVTVNVLGNDAALFGSTKIITAHPAGLAQNMGGGVGELVYMPTTGLLYAGSSRTVGVIDPTGNHLVGRMPIAQGDPGATYGVASPQTGLVFFRMGGNGTPGATIYAYDARPGSPTFHQSFPIPAAASLAIDAMGDAHTFALDSTGKVLFYIAGNSTQQSIVAIDADPASPNAGSFLWPAPISLPANSRAMHLVQNPATGKVYIASINVGVGPPQGGVFVINPAAPAPPVKITGADHAVALAVNPATNLIFAAGSNGNFRLNTIDGATDMLIGQVAVTAGGAPIGNAEDRIAVHHASGTVFMRAAARIFVFDGLKGSSTFNTLRATITVDGDFGQVDMVLDQTTGVLATVSGFFHSVSLIDAATVASTGVVTPLALPRSAARLAADPVNGRLFLADGSGAIHTVDAPTSTTAAVTNALTVAPETAQVLINPVTNRAYAASSGVGSTLSVISGAGQLGPVSGLSLQQGRWGFGARYDATNTFFMTNSASNVTGTRNRPGSLAMIDGATDTVTALVPTIASPFGAAVNQAAGQLIVAGFNGLNPSGIAEHGRIRVHSVSSPLSFADVDTSAIVPFNANSLAFGRHIVVDPNSNEVYVMVTGGSNTSALRFPTQPLPAAPVAVPIDFTPFGPADRADVIRINPQGTGPSMLYFGLFNSTTAQYNVVAMRGDTHAIVASYAGGGHSRQHTASWLAVNPAANRLYVVDYNADTVTMLDGTTLAVLAVTPLPDGPSATAFNVSQNRLYVSSINSKTITALDGATLAVQSTVQLPLHAYFLHVNETEGRIYTSGGNSFDESGFMVLSDVGGQLGAPVTVTSATNGGGTTTVNADSSITYTPAPGFSGPDSFTYTAQTAAGSSTATVHVNVIPVVSAPTASSDAYSTPEGVVLNVGGRGVLANDAVSNFATAVLGFTSGPGLTLNPNGSFQFVPSGPGLFQFTYVALDGVNSNAATVSINVVAAPNPLVVTTTANSGPGSLREAIDYANTTPGAQTITFAIPGVTPAAPAVINLQTALPVITQPVTIDATTQAGYDGRPVVEVTNNGGGSIAVGFETGFDVSSVTIRGFSITRFLAAGIQLLQADTAPPATGHVVTGNILGTDRNSAPLKGNSTGIIVRRDGALVTGNVISGNTGPGVVIHTDGDGVQIVGNTIGLANDNVVARPNAVGIVLSDSVDNAIIDGNIISGNNGLGIDIQDSLAGDVTGTMIIANRIGLNQLGDPVPNSGGGIQINNAPGTQVGIAGNGNIISGNAHPGFLSGGPGIRVLGSPAVVPTIRANKIGVDPTGQVARPNRFEGIILYGRAEVGGLRSANEGNLISGNGNIATGGGTGILIVAGADGSIVRGNTIGLTASGTPLGNAYSGISVIGDVTSVTIGGDDNDQVNTISGNPAAGIAVYAIDTGAPGSAPRPREIQFQGNSIYGNGGLGIDLDNNGVSVNDTGDTDPLLGNAANDLQNFPVLTSAVNNGAFTQVAVDLATLETGDTFRVRFYSNPSCDTSGNGEGQFLIGVADIVQPGGSVNLPLVPVGQALTATATDGDGNTSEFSACRVVTTTAPPATISSVSPDPSAPGFGQFLWIRGTNLPGVNPADVILNVGGGPDVVANNVWHMSPTLVIARFYLGPVQPSGPGSIRVKSPDNSIVSNSFPITLSATPAAPILTAVTGPCSGSGFLSSANGGGSIWISAEGIDTSGVTAVFTPTSPAGAPIEVPVVTTSSCQPAAMSVAVNVPSFQTLSNTQVNVQLFTKVNGGPASPLSTAHSMTVTTSLSLAGPAGDLTGAAFGPLFCPAGTSAVGFTVHAGQPYALTSADLRCSDASTTPKFGGGTIPDTAVACNPGDVMVGMIGTIGQPFASTNMPTSVAPRCQNASLTGGITEPASPLPGGGVSFGAIDCPAGQRVVGVMGGQGAVVDHLYLVCGTP